jgi:hypothetical protein
LSAVATGHRPQATFLDALVSGESRRRLFRRLRQSSATSSPACPAPASMTHCHSSPGHASHRLLPAASDWAARSHRLPVLLTRPSHHKGAQLRVNSLCGSIAPPIDPERLSTSLCLPLFPLVSAPVTRPTAKNARAYRRGTVWTRLGARLRHSRNRALPCRAPASKFFLLSCPRASSLH